MSFKILADTFSVARDSNHFVQLKTLKNPRSTDQVWVAFEVEGNPAEKCHILVLVLLYLFFAVNIQYRDADGEAAVLPDHCGVIDCLQGQGEAIPGHPGGVIPGDRPLEIRGRLKFLGRTAPKFA